MKLTEAEAKLKKLEVCWIIEGQNAQIQNQGLKWKGGLTSELTFKFGRDTIELILKIKISIEDWFGNKDFLESFSFKLNNTFCTK